MNYYELLIHKKRIMELSDLHIFCTVVRTGGIIRAADYLHRVPSNITTRMKKLEEDVGAALFLREGKRMQLSPAGRILLDYADRLLSLANEAREALQDGHPRGIFRIGTMESTAAARLPEPLSKFHGRYPDISVELHTGDPQHLVAKVLAGELDTALVAEPVSDARLDKLIAFEEEMVVVAKAGHPRIASAKDVVKRTLLAFHHGCPHRKRLENWFERSGVAPDRLVEVASYHAILGCVIAGMGIALMPRSVLDTYTERSRLSIHELNAKFRKARTLLIWRKHSPQPNIAAFREILLSQARQSSNEIEKNRKYAMNSCIEYKP
jgi:DNA-binding transcriptional LysR family regulator